MGLASWIGRKLLRLPVVRDMARLAVEDFGHNPNLKTASSGNGRDDIGFDPPVGRAAEAGDAAEWPDPVFELDTEGHYKIRTSPPALVAFEKAGSRLAKLDWTVQGGNPKRCEQFKYMITHTPGWVEMLTWFAWARADGLRFMQIKTLDAKLNPSEWLLPDLRGGGRLKLRAGGRIHWDGVNLYDARTAEGIILKEPRIIRERDQFMVHRPGAGSSPNGDSDLGVALVNLCGSWWDGFMADKVYKRRYNQEIYTSGRRKIRPPNVQASYAAAAAKMVELNASGPDGVIVVSDEDDIKLRQLQTGGLQDLWHGIEKVAGVIYLLILGTKITSDASDQSGVGSTGVGLAEELAAALKLANGIAETINADLMPWYASRNEDTLEKLGENEEECYVVPQAPKTSDQGDVNTGKDEAPDDELAEETMPGEAHASEEEMPGMKKMPMANMSAFRSLMTTLATHQSAEHQKKKHQVATLAVENLTPPVHPNCRCQIIDDIWYDASDTRVCPVCLLLGASWNLRLDAPVEPGEVERILDKKNLDEIKAAVESDGALADQVIVQSAENVESGVIKSVAFTEAEPAHITIERELVKARAAARAQAAVPPGTFIRGVGRIPEGLVFESTPKGKKAALVSVNVATSEGYRVIWRAGKYLLQTKGGRTLDSGGDLWWLLLLLGLMEKKRREDAAREEAERNAQSKVS